MQILLISLYYKYASLLSTESPSVAVGDKTFTVKQTDAESYQMFCPPKLAWELWCCWYLSQNEIQREMCRNLSVSQRAQVIRSELGLTDLSVSHASELRSLFLWSVCNGVKTWVCVQSCALHLSIALTCFFLFFLTVKQAFELGLLKFLMLFICLCGVINML